MAKQILIFLIRAVMITGLGIRLALANIDGQIIKLNGHAIHYVKYGAKGRPLILLTGYATTSNFWHKDFISCLAGKYQVYLLDYQGILTTDQSTIKSLSIVSMASDVNQFTKQLKLRQSLLLGWSMGGAVALQASFLAPHTYSYLYLLAPVVPNPTGILRDRPSHPTFHSEADVLDYVFNNNLYSYSPAEQNQLRTKFLNPRLSLLFPKGQIISLQESAIHQWRSNPKTMQLFKKNQVPASFYIPEHDAIINQALALPVIEKYPSAEIIEVKNSGHALAWQKPQEICQDISAKN